MKERTIFLDFVGENPKTKILQLLLIGREEEYTLNDIVRATHVNRKNAYKILNEMVAQNSLLPTNKIKNIQFYNINTQKEEIKILIKLFDKLIGMKEEPIKVKH